MIYHCSQRLPSQVCVYTHTIFAAGKTQKITCLLTEALICICCAFRGGASPENVSPVRALPSKHGLVPRLLRDCFSDRLLTTALGRLIPQNQQHHSQSQSFTQDVFPSPLHNPVLCHPWYIQKNNTNLRWPRRLLPEPHPGWANKIYEGTPKYQHPDCKKVVSIIKAEQMFQRSVPGRSRKFSQSAALRSTSGEWSAAAILLVFTE